MEIKRVGRNKFVVSTQKQKYFINSDDVNEINSLNK